MDDPVVRAASHPVQTVREAFEDFPIARRGHRTGARVAAVVGVVALSLTYLGWRRPFDVALFPGAVQLCLAAAIGFGALVVAGALVDSEGDGFLRRMGVGRTLALTVGSLGLLATIPVLAFAVVFIAEPASHRSFDVPSSGVAVDAVTYSNVLQSDELVLTGHLGPVGRRRTLASLGFCRVSTAAPVGPGVIDLTVDETTEGGCGSLGEYGGVYRITVLEDGWSTSIEQILVSR